MNGIVNLTLSYLDIIRCLPCMLVALKYKYNSLFKFVGYNDWFISYNQKSMIRGGVEEERSGKCGKCPCFNEIFFLLPSGYTILYDIKPHIS